MIHKPTATENATIGLEENKKELEIEERMRILANLIIDRVLDDQKNGKLRFTK